MVWWGIIIKVNGIYAGVCSPEISRLCVTQMNEVSSSDFVGPTVLQSTQYVKRKKQSQICHFSPQ